MQYIINPLLGEHLCAYVVLRHDVALCELLNDTERIINLL
jgi:hypothetical protein